MLFTMKETRFIFHAIYSILINKIYPWQISSQKRILEAYAKQNGFTNLRWYTDDGFSGANFQRPGFQAMQNHFWLRTQRL